MAIDQTRSSQVILWLEETCLKQGLSEWGWSPAASASPGNQLQTPVLRPHLDLLNQILGGGACELCFNKPSGHRWLALKFESHRWRVCKLRQAWEGAGELNGTAKCRDRILNFPLPVEIIGHCPWERQTAQKFLQRRGPSTTAGGGWGGREKRVGENFQEGEVTEELRMMMCVVLL